MVVAQVISTMGTFGGKLKLSKIFRASIGSEEESWLKGKLMLELFVRIENYKVTYTVENTQTCVWDCLIEALGTSVDMSLVKIIRAKYGDMPK